MKILSKLITAITPYCKMQRLDDISLFQMILFKTKRGFASWKIYSRTSAPISFLVATITRIKRRERRGWRQYIRFVFQLQLLGSICKNFK